MSEALQAVWSSRGMPPDTRSPPNLGGPGSLNGTSARIFGLTVPEFPLSSASDAMTDSSWSGCGRTVQPDAQCVIGRRVTHRDIVDVEARLEHKRLQGRRNGWMDNVGIIGEDYNTWSLCSGKIDWNVSSEVNAQELPMI